MHKEMLTCSQVSMKCVCSAMMAINNFISNQGRVVVFVLYLEGFFFICLVCLYILLLLI